MTIFIAFVPPAVCAAIMIGCGWHDCIKQGTEWTLLTDFRQRLYVITKLSL